MPITFTEIDVTPIPKRELRAYSEEVKFELYRQLRKRFHELKTRGFDQQHLAKRLGVNKSLVSRRLRGENDMGIETLSDLARGLECRIDVRLLPFDQIPATRWHGGQPLKYVAPAAASESNAKAPQVIGANVIA